MSNRLRLADLRAMSPAESHEVLASLARAAQAPGAGEAASRSVEARIRGYEFRYEMSSSEMKEGLKSGRLAETADLSNWLFLLNARDGHLVTR